MHRAKYRSRVAARRDPDGQDGGDENQILRQDDEPEEVGQDAVLYNPAQGDCKRDFGPARRYGRQRC